MRRLKGLSAEASQALFPEGIILLGYRGSVAHEMYVPNTDPDSIDDKDLMGVFIGPPEHYIGFGRKPHKEAFCDPWDVVSYELVKFVRMLLKANPNVLSLLWLKDVYYVDVHPIGQRLLDNRELFVTKRAYHSFNGYAYGQFKRMTHFKFEGYMGEKRKALVEKHGYDTKNAAHLIRLLRMGIEFLAEGELHVARGDAEQLLAIKRGEWSLDKVKEESERLFRLAEEVYVRSTLPDRPDEGKVEELVGEMISEFHLWG
jgi:predicted nucleotidyltransferase